MIVSDPLAGFGPISFSPPPVRRGRARVGVYSECFENPFSSRSCAAFSSKTTYGEHGRTEWKRFPTQLLAQNDAAGHIRRIIGPLRSLFPSDAPTISPDAEAESMA